MFSSEDLMISDDFCLVVTGTWLDYDDFPILILGMEWNVIIPTDKFHDFSEGFKPPTSFCVSANEINLLYLLNGKKKRGTMMIQQWILGYPIFRQSRVCK